MTTAACPSVPARAARKLTASSGVQSATSGALKLRRIHHRRWPTLRAERQVAELRSDWPGRGAWGGGSACGGARSDAGRGPGGGAAGGKMSGCAGGGGVERLRRFGRERTARAPTPDRRTMRRGGRGRNPIRPGPPEARPPRAVAPVKSQECARSGADLGGRWPIAKELVHQATVGQAREVSQDAEQERKEHNQLQRVRCGEGRSNRVDGGRCGSGEGAHWQALPAKRRPAFHSNSSRLWMPGEVKDFNELREFKKMEFVPLLCFLDFAHSLECLGTWRTELKGRNGIQRTGLPQILAFS